MMQKFTRSDLEELFGKAGSHKRNRFPAAMQDAEYAGPQALINAVLPSSYIRPHKHSNREIWIPLYGEGFLLYFTEEGKLQEKIRLSHEAVLYEEVPEQRYHCFITQRQMSFVTINPGPHDPSAKIQAPWAPEEGTAEAEAYLAKLRELVGRF